MNYLLFMKEISMWALISYSQALWYDEGYLWGV